MQLARIARSNNAKRFISKFIPLSNKDIRYQKNGEVKKKIESAGREVKNVEEEEIKSRKKKEEGDAIKRVEKGNLGYGYIY
jgi:chromatin remodeling complex protein RSC6